jgi:hypothetical protein
MDIKITIYGGERVPHRHTATSKALQPLLALVSYETDEEQYGRFLGCDYN